MSYYKERLKEIALEQSTSKMKSKPRYNNKPTEFQQKSRVNQVERLLSSIKKQRIKCGNIYEQYAIEHKRLNDMKDCYKKLTGKSDR